MFSFLRVCALFLALVLVSAMQSLLPTVHAATVDDIKSQISEQNSRIQAIEAEIATYQKQLNVLGGERQTLQTAIKTIDVSRQQTSSQISATQTRISASNLKLSELSYEIKSKEDVILLDKEVLSRSFRSIESATEASLVEQILSSESLSDAWVAVDSTADLSRSLEEHARTLGEAKAELTVQHATVASTREKLASLNAELASQKKSLDVVKAQKDSLLVQTKNKESTYQDLIAQKRAEQVASEAAIFKLSQQLKSADTTKVPAAGKGILSWPLDTVRLTQTFGKTSDSGRLYTTGSHNGVDFGIPVGTPVRAALMGTVLASNTISAAQDKKIGYCQYGSWVLIKHANGLSTLYSHLSDVSVSKGQTVTTGQTIGYSGMTGYATGPHLHFGVYNSESVTFTNYKCGSGYTVYIPVAPTNGYLDPMQYL